ncbi:hypothetical protein AB0M29_34165 [Streptomyces sp. NPDC051976]|uniref:hypothetical protein n=1 Tax=Streptomyces sp. NPDC051976 TaxID=3154947 RepID=UPI00343B36CB
MRKPVVPLPLPRRVAHALLHRLPRRGRPDPRARLLQLRALEAILDDAVAAQTPSDLVVAACGEPGPVGELVARTGGEQLMVYHRLTVRLQHLPLDGEPAELGQAAARLFQYHEWMIHEALSLAFSSRPDARTAAARRRINGIGAPADALRDLRETVRAMAASAPDAAGEPPR